MIGNKNRNVILNEPNIKLDNKISRIHFVEIYMSTWLTKGKTSMDIHDIIVLNNFLFDYLTILCPVLSGICFILFEAYSSPGLLVPAVDVI